MEIIKNLSGNMDSLATLIVALLLGWEIAQPEKNTDNSNLDTSVLDMLVRNSLIGPQRASALMFHFGAEKLLCLLAEGDTQELSTCPGIGDKLSTKMVRGLTYLAQDMCREMELNNELAEKPCFETISEDHEQEHFFQVWEKDSWGKPGWVSYPTWVNNNNRYLTTLGDSQPRGWSGLQPHQAAVQAEPVENMVQESTDNDVPEKQFYSAARPYKAQHNSYLTAMLWVYNTSDKARLEQGWKKFWRKFFALKKSEDLGSWMTQTQRARLILAFRAKGVGTEGAEKVALEQLKRLAEAKKEQQAPKPLPPKKVAENQPQEPVATPNYRGVRF